MSARKNMKPAPRGPTPKGNAKSRKGLQLSVSRAPIAQNYRVVPRAPQMSVLSTRETVITGHEEVATVSGSVGFSATRYRFNPGLDLYTRLSKIAGTFEKYRVRSLEFVYVPADAVTTTKGVVYLAGDYDPVDAAPASLAALSTYETQDSSRVYDALKLRLSNKRMFDGVQAKKIRCGPVGGDLQLYDACSVSVATISCADTSALGQLWVYYDLVLISPQTEPATPVPQSLSGWNLSASQTLTTSTGVALAVDETMVDGLEMGAPSSGVLTLPCGMFEVRSEVSFQDSASEDLAVSLEMQADSANLSPPVISVASATVPANGQLAVSATAYVVSDGTTTLRAFVTATGSAGLLQALVDRSRIWVRAL